MPPRDRPSRLLTRLPSDRDEDRERERERERDGELDLDLDLDLGVEEREVEGLAGLRRRPLPDRISPDSGELGTTTIQNEMDPNPKTNPLAAARRSEDGESHSPIERPAQK